MPTYRTALSQGLFFWSLEASPRQYRGTQLFPEVPSRLLQEAVGRIFHVGSAVGASVHLSITPHSSYPEPLFQFKGAVQRRCWSTKWARQSRKLQYFHRLGDVEMRRGCPPYVSPKLRFQSHRAHCKGQSCRLTASPKSVRSIPSCPIATVPLDICLE